MKVFRQTLPLSMCPLTSLSNSHQNNRNSQIIENKSRTEGEERVERKNSTNLPWTKRRIRARQREWKTGGGKWLTGSFFGSKEHKHTIIQIDRWIDRVKDKHHLLLNTLIGWRWSDSLMMEWTRLTSLHDQRKPALVSSWSEIHSWSEIRNYSNLNGARFSSY